MSGYKFGDLSGSKSGMCVGDTTTDPDARIDADETATPDGAVCFGNGLVHPCFASAPSGTKTINTPIDTNGAMCATLVGANANAWCVIAGATVSVQGTVTVIGTRPLVLLSTGVIQVPGTLDVASHRGGSQGPAADLAGCNAGTAPTMTSGGAGGSFAGAGGAGAVAGGGTAGMPGGVLTVSSLRGGCPGQTGAGGGGGAAGHGGGAVYMIAGTSITISGVVNASGSSGINANANSSSGGGGGGTGGYIGLEAATITVTGAQLFANGGAGGEASGSMSTGNPGTDSPAPATAAIGGNGGTNFGTDGGNGSQGAPLTGAPAAAACTTPCTTPAAGGGGGGGAGIIKTFPTQTLSGATISPPAI